MQSLIRFLTSTGLGSRRHCFDLIINGNVQVNDVVSDKTSLPINVGIDKIRIRGQLIKDPKRKVYLKLHKPRGIISTVSDDHGRKTVVDLIPAEYKKFHLYPIGRLDSETSGLMIMTNDGNLANVLTHPKFEVPKEYQVLLDRTLKETELSRLQKGVEINGYRTSRCKIVRLHKNPESWYSVTIHEGKKRELRYIFLSVGATVVRLYRIRIGQLKLGNLRVGECEELTHEELNLLNPKCTSN